MQAKSLQEPETHGLRRLQLPAPPHFPAAVRCRANRNARVLRKRFVGDISFTGIHFHAANFGHKMAGQKSDIVRPFPQRTQWTKLALTLSR